MIFRTENGVAVPYSNLSDNIHVDADEINIIDTEGLLGTAGATTNVQALVDEIADKFIPNTDIINTAAGDNYYSTKVASSGWVHTVADDVSTLSQSLSALPPLTYIHASSADLAADNVMNAVLGVVGNNDTVFLGYINTSSGNSFISGHHYIYSAKHYITAILINITGSSAFTYKHANGESSRKQITLT